MRGSAFLRGSREAGASLGRAGRMLGSEAASGMMSDCYPRAGGGGGGGGPMCVSFCLCWSVLYTATPVVQTAGGLVYICMSGPYGLVQAIEAHV
jgi:hypothetical protein